MGSGVYTPQTLQTLLGSSRTADLSLAVQALQNQTQSTEVNALQSTAHQLSTERYKETSSRANPPPMMDSDHTNTAEDFQPLPNALRHENGGFYNKPVGRQSE